MLVSAEVFVDLKENRNFKNNDLFFKRKESSLEIVFKSGDLKMFKDLIEVYGFGEEEKTYGLSFDIFLNNIKIDPFNFDFNLIKLNDIIKICYIESGCFELYFHLIAYEVDEFHDDDYYFRKELEK
jgi:hypothetical protein